MGDRASHTGYSRNEDAVEESAVFRTPAFRNHRLVCTGASRVMETGIEVRWKCSPLAIGVMRMNQGEFGKPGREGESADSAFKLVMYLAADVPHLVGRPYPSLKP